MLGECLFVSLDLSIYDFQEKEVSNVRYSVYLLKRWDTVCEIKGGYYFSIDLHDIFTIKEFRLMLIKSSKENRINSFRLKHNYYMK